MRTAGAREVGSRDDGNRLEAVEAFRGGFVEYPLFRQALHEGEVDLRQIVEEASAARRVEGIPKFKYVALAKFFGLLAQGRFTLVCHFSSISCQWF